jgi:hypothetical protein
MTRMDADGGRIDANINVDETLLDDTPFVMRITLIDANGANNSKTADRR